MLAMHPDIETLCTFALKVGLTRDAFLHKLKSKKISKHRKMPSTESQTKSKMLIWMKKEALGHPGWEECK